MSLRDAFQELPDDAFSRANLEVAAEHRARQGSVRDGSGEKLNSEDAAVVMESLRRDFPAIADYIQFLKHDGGEAMGRTPAERDLIGYGAYLLGLMIKRVSDQQILDGLKNS